MHYIERKAYCLMEDIQPDCTERSRLIFNSAQSLRAGKIASFPVDDHDSDNDDDDDDNANEDDDDFVMVSL